MAEITVTSGDLANGRPTPSADPLTRAVRRAFPGAWFVTAGPQSLTVIDRDGTREHPLPDEVQAIMATWREWPDRVRPFRFTLPEAVARPALSRTPLPPPAPPRPVTVLATPRPEPAAPRGRCGQAMGWRGEKRCGRPAGHTPGLHLSEEACERRARANAARTAVRSAS